ncbi:hypothetical protein [Bradyrhizobium cenepequi]
MAPIFALPSQRALFAVTGINPATYRSDVFRDQSVAAFGASEPVARDRPLVLDAVAIRLRDELQELGLSRKLAASIVRGFFDRWAEGVAYADHENQDVIFAVIEFDPRKFRDVPWVCTVGPAEKFEDYLKTLPRPRRRIVFVHLRETLADLRERAAKAKVELPEHFFVSPEHPLLAQIKTDWAKWRADNKVGIKLPKLERQYRQSVEDLLQ